MELNKLLKISDEELEEKFIYYFGKDKWEQENELARLLPIQMIISDYLNIDLIPVIVEDIECESIYNKELNYIAISSRIILNKELAIINLIKQLINYRSTNADS